MLALAVGVTLYLYALTVKNQIHSGESLRRQLNSQRPPFPMPDAGLGMLDPIPRPERKVRSFDQREVWRHV